MEAFRHFPVGVSVEQIAAAWARTELAPEGSTVMIDNEIGGRLRLGIPWKVDPTRALSCAVVLRPGLGLEAEAVLWIVGQVAAARVAREGQTIYCGWPERLVNVDGNEVGAVGLDVQLGPGKVASAAVSLRLDLHSLGRSIADRRSIAEQFATEVQACAAMLTTTRADLLDEYARASALVGRRVRAKLLPKGETRGTAVAVDPLGQFVLQSPTGMLERLSPVSVLRIDPA